jgi:hypothetical protein
MELICNEDIKRILIIAPPEAAKTTWLVSAYLGARIGFFPNQSVIISAITDDVAEKRSGSLRVMTQTSIWRTIFPGVIRASSMRWNPREWSLADGGMVEAGRLHPTMRSYGSGSSIVGSRADFMLGDDLLDLDNTRTSHQRGLTRDWFETSFLSRLKSAVGRVVVIGTAWNAADLYSDLRRSPGWVVCHTPLMDDSERDGFHATISYPGDFTGKMLGSLAGEAVI